MTRKTLLALFILAVSGLLLTQTLLGPDTAGNRDSDGLVSPAAAMGPPGGGGPNAAPLAEAGRDRQADLGETVVLDGSDSSDENGDSVTYAWSLVSAPAGSTAALNDATLVKPSFLVDLAGDYVFELIINDGSDDSTPDQVTVSTVNVAPASAAGADQTVVLGTNAILDGTGSSDAEGDLLGYSWQLTAKPAGSAAALSDPTSPRPGFFVDLAGTYQAEVTVSDPALAGAADSVTVITEGADNMAPLAEAGFDQTGVPAVDLTLDAENSSDLDGDLLTFQWSLLAAPPGEDADISDDMDRRTQINFTGPGTYVIQLVVSDGTAESAPDTVVISTGSVAPAADAGPDQAIAALQEVELDGSGSTDVNGDLLQFEWALVATPAGSTAALDDSTAIRPKFTADLAGTYVAQLLVHDGAEESPPDTVTLSSDNLAPVANAGPDQYIPVLPNTVVVDGSGSYDPAGEALSYRWSLLLAPKKSKAALSDPTAAAPTFDADKTGSYLLQLVVNDGPNGTGTDSAPDLILVSAKGQSGNTDVNVRPVADAGPDQEVLPGALVQLDGSATTDTNNPEDLTYRWALTHKPAGSTAVLSDPTAVNPTFTADISGTYLAQLIANDTMMDSFPGTVLITPANMPPVADAGPDQSVMAGSLVQLDGSGSSDPDEDPLTYAWNLLTKPAGSVALLSDPTAVNPTFVTDAPGIYGLQLVVNDGFVSSPADSIYVTANPVTAQNEPPVLNPIGNLSVDLGSSLSLTLTATDVNGDPLTFNASPLPLPDGASLNGMNGDFSFTPDASQVGDIALTFSVSDGLLTDSESVVITVNGPPGGGVTALTGRVVDTNDFVVNGEPGLGVQGAVVTIGTESATTDVNGDFTLTGIVAGFPIIDIDTSMAMPAPDGSDYAGFRELIEVIANVTNVVDRPFYLPRIDTTGAAIINPATTTVVDNTNLGVTLEVMDNSASYEGGGLIPLGDEVELTVSEVPLSLAPAALPEDFEPDMLITIQPVGVTFDPQNPAQITFPNTDGYAPSSEVDIYSIDPVTGQFYVVAVGTVSVDGTEIVTTSGGIVAATWHFPLGPLPSGDGGENNPGNEDPNNCTECEGNSSVHLHNGNLAEEHRLVSYRSFNQDRALTFVYNSTAADPQPIVVTNTTVLQRSAVPDTISTRLRVGGVEVTEEEFTDTQNPTPLSGGTDETIRQAVQFDAMDFATGSYPYELLITNTFGNSRVTARQPGRLLVNNEIDSPFGAGWSLDGLERLHLEAGGVRATLTKGDGSILRFDPGLSTPEPFLQTAMIEEVRRSSTFVTADLDNDGDDDIVAPDWHTGRLFVLFGDGQGQFPVIQDYPSGLSSAQTGGGPDLIDAATGDFNDDGWQDIAVVNQDSNRITLYQNTGSGAFTQLTSLIPGGGVQAQVVESADFNGDNFDDIFVGRKDHQAILFPSNGDGTFQSHSIITIAANAVASTILDLEPDGDTDIVVASAGTNQLSILNNDGSGVFTVSNISAGTLRSTPNRSFVGTGDFNGDDDPDIVNANIDSDTISVHLADGSGGYLPRVTYATGDGPNTLDVGDMNGDGTLDIMIANAHSDDLGLFLGDGQGTFSQANAGSFATPGLSPGLNMIRLGNFDGDGRPDIAVGVVHATSGAMYAFLNVSLGAGVFTSPPGDFSILTRNPDDSFTRRLKNGTEIHYDANGLMTARVDRNGNTTSYGYDAQDRLTTITDPSPAALTTTLFYDDDGDEYLDRIVDPAGRATLFDTDSNGDLVKITDPDLSERIFAYDARHLLTQQLSKRGFPTDYTPGFHGRTIRADRPDGSNNQFAPAQVVGLIDPASGFGTVASPAAYTRPDEVEAVFTDGNGNVTTYELNNFGSLTEVVDALIPPRTTTTTKDGDNLASQVIRPNGRIDDLVYDSMGNLLTFTEAVSDPLLEHFVTVEYEPQFSRPIVFTDPENNVSRSFYDTSGNLERTIDANLVETLFANDDPNCPGLRTSTTKALGLPEEAVSTAVYDPLSCNLIESRDPLNNPVTFLHDSAGNIIEVTDAVLQSTRLEYDSMNRKIMSVDARNMAPVPVCGTLGVTCFVYDSAGNLESLTDGNGNVTSFDYDQRDRINMKTDPIMAFETYTYDGNGNLRFFTDRKLQVTEFRYDETNRLKEKVFLPGTVGESIRNFSYDLMDNLENVVDPNSALTNTFDILNRLNSTSTAGSPVQPSTTLTYTYDKNNNRKSIDTGMVGPTTYNYDALDRLDDLTIADFGLIDFEYDPLSRRKLIARPNNVDTSYSYDTANRFDTISHVFVPTAQTLAFFDYDVDSIGRRISLVQSRSGLSFTPTIAYTYDETGQLESADPSVLGGLSETYDYDSLGNRNTSHISSSYVYGDANRHLEDDSFCYDYDANGNLEIKTMKVLGACSGTTTTYSWDVENRLVRIDLPGGSVAQYTYDGFGRRIQKDLDGITKTYVYDGENIHIEYGATGNLLAAFSHGARIDEPLVIQRDLDSSGTIGLGESFAYHTDGIGSIIAISDDQGNAVSELAYETFGIESAAIGSVDSPYGFTGREFDPESGMYYYRARYYNPQVGRFIQEDPISFNASDANLYRYVFNGPVNLVDPSGLLSILVQGGIAGGSTFGGGIDVGVAFDCDTGEAFPFITIGGGFAAGLEAGANVSLFSGSPQDLDGWGIKASGAGLGIGGSAIISGSVSLDGVDFGGAGAGVGGALGLGGYAGVEYTSVNSNPTDNFLGIPIPGPDSCFNPCNLFR